MKGLHLGWTDRLPRFGALLALGALFVAGTAAAVMPVAKTVPVVASNVLIPHDTLGSTHLKGTVTLPFGATVSNFQYSWDFGDGTTAGPTTVVNPYDLSATHTYSGAPGTVFTATLTVVDTTAPSDKSSAFYYTEMRATSQQVRVNIAIDEGLWYLHTNMFRTNTASGGADHNPAGTDIGNWYSFGPYSTGNVNIGYVSVTATNMQAYEVNGHQESNPSTDPYTEDMQRSMKWLMSTLTPSSVSPGTKTYPTTNGSITVYPQAPNGTTTVTWDTNGNGLAMYSSLENDPGYENGILMDAIVASGTPLAVATTGPTGVVGRTYRDIVQDMVDWYAYCQGNNNPYHGGWRYTCGYGAPDSDNSTNQWASIGLMGAKQFGATVPSFISQANLSSVALTEGFTGASPPTGLTNNGYPNGEFGYTNSPATAWGPYAVTPSGLVQLTLDQIGRGDARWDLSESFMRNNFCNALNTGPGGTPRQYLYGLFSLTKAMLLHAPGGVKTPIAFLSDVSGGVTSNPIDWYAAAAAKGDACDGVAEVLLSYQFADGHWFGPSYTSTHYYFTTAWSIIMLNKTVFSSGQPVAVATANPNPAVLGENVTLNGAGSFHQDPSKAIVSWQWDIGNNGTYDLTGVNVTWKFMALGSYPVRLHVCDNGTPAECADTIITVVVSTPPLPPTANAGGPYNFCRNKTPWFVDGSKSTTPNQGLNDGTGGAGQPTGAITTWAWDLHGGTTYADASGPTPDVTSILTGFANGGYFIGLKVTDNTALAFPASGLGNLSATATAQVTIRAGTDPSCSCITITSVTPKSGKLQLIWGAASPAPLGGYAVLRSTTSGGPYTQVGTTTSTLYVDTGLTNGTTYYYVVQPLAANGTATCQSLQVSGKPAGR